MDGLIHEKTDLKVLILYSLSRMPAAAGKDTIYDICRSDGGVGYFDFSDCFEELIASGHIEQGGDGYIITEKGTRDGAALEASLPQSVKNHAEGYIRQAEDNLNRLSMISADHRATDSGMAAELSLSDGVGRIMKLEILCADETQAKLIEKNFTAGAEDYYRKILDLLTKKSG